MRALILLPEIEERSFEYATSLSTTFGGQLDVVLPSTLDALPLPTVEALRKVVGTVTTFATRPTDIFEAHHTGALAVAVEYELATIAIPVHYQNICDLIRRKYGFPAVRDSQVLRILSSADHVQEMAPGVFRSSYRSRDNRPAAAIAHWVALLQTQFFEGVYDLDAYCTILDEWYTVPAAASESLDIPRPTIGGWLQVEDGDLIRVVRLERGSYQERLTVRADSEFWRMGAIRTTIKGSLGEVDDLLLDRIGAAQQVRQELGSSPEGTTAGQALRRYADLWIGYVRDGEARGQAQKWRGWYLVPEHGALTISKLQELQRIAAAIRSLEAGGMVLVDRSPEGVANAVALLSTGGVVYQKPYSDSAKRDLFVRQQKNYLVRLGLVTEPVPNYLALTPEGLTWARLRSKVELVRAFQAIVEELRWSWCNMPFFSFLRDLADQSDGFVTYTELFNWVIHAYDRSQLDEVTRALAIYRSLSDRNRSAVDEQIERALQRALSRYASSSAFGHYRTKVKDLMVAFATSGDFHLVDSPDLRLVRNG